MNTNVAPHISNSRRPILVRVANKWYSWAGLALTVTGAYLAANGQLRMGDSPRLQAAPPGSSPIQWKPAHPSDDAPKLVLSPVAPPADPFKAIASPPTEVKPAETPVLGPSLPDPFVAPVKPTEPSRTKAVLEAYVSGKPAELPVPPPAALPRLDGSVVGNPAIKAVAGPDLPIAPLPKPDMGKPEAPKAVPLPMPVPPVPMPGMPKLPPMQQGNGAKLPPIPVAPVAAPPVVPALPVGRPADLRISEDVTLQEPETIPFPPKASTAAPDKKVASERPSNIIGKLETEDLIKLAAAKNAANLKDWPRASALMAEIIAKYPNEYGLRAELAGFLIAAGDAKRAIIELEAVIQKAQNVASHRLLLGDAYMSVRNYKGAAATYMVALEMVQSDPKLSAKTPEVVIRAARAFALDNDLFRAAQLVDRYLAGIRPDDERAPLALGSMLLDLDRPYDALPYLIDKRKQLLRDTAPANQEDHDLKLLEVLASMVRGFGRVGERQQAMEAINEMAAKVPTQTGIRVSLADILFEMGEYELGGHVYNQVLATDPVNGAALIGIARVYLETFQPVAAKRILDSFVPNATNQRGYLMTYSSYHQTIGEYTEAKQIYKDMLRRNENDHEVRYALGRVYEYTKEWEKAKAEFAKIPPQDKMARKARLWFGYALLHQRKFAEAAQVADGLMRDDPNNPEGIALSTRALAKMGSFDKAVQIGRGYLATNPKDDRSANVVRLAVGRALLEGNRNLEAAREFEIALTKPAGRIPEAYYGLARAAERLGNGDRAQQVVGSLTGAMGGDLRSRLLLAEYYADDYEDQKVIEIANSIAGYDNDNLAVLIRLADAQQRAARWPGNPSDCFATCQRILRQSPTNVRGHLAMARSFAVAQNFRKSSVQYDQLIAIDPEFTIPPRERARILYSDHQFSAARTQYNVVLSPTPEEVVLNQMSFYAQRDAKLRQVFGPYVTGAMAGPALRAELARIAASAGDEEVKMAAHRMICDYDATLAWQEPFRLERDAKELKDYRNYMAIPQYAAITNFEPTNTEALFDYGQVYGALKMTRAALTWYSNTIAVDPTHREAIAASERATAEISPKVDFKYDWMRQRGRTGVASIDRQRFIGAVALPLGDENEYLQLGYMRIGYNPLDDTNLWGNAPFLRVQKKWDDNRLMTYGQVNVEQYPNRFSTRPTFDAGMWYDHNDVVRSRLGGFLENVAENGESLRQDIYRYGAYAGVDVKPTRTWAFGGTFTYAHYSDDNDMTQGFLYNEVALTLPPKLLKLVQRFNVWSYREQTVFPTAVPDPNNLFGTIHPYFTPGTFTSGELRVEWWHWLSRDYFVHSNQCYYSLQYGISTDNNLITYHDMRFIANYDVNSWLSFGGELRSTLSTGDAYNLYSAMGFMQIRLAGFGH